MFSHVMLGASNLDKSRQFYDALLGALGQSVEAARTAVDRMWERFNN